MPTIVWQFRCPCGARGYAYDPHDQVTMSCGHVARRGAAAVEGGEVMGSRCPECGHTWGDHLYRRYPKDCALHAICPEEDEDG